MRPRRPDVGEDRWRHHELQYLYFSVQDLEGARRRCEAAGATEITKIASMPWGETMFRLFGKPWRGVREFLKEGGS
jgi:uncharacterized glyoxalase superfamily protein PhnB